MSSQAFTMDDLREMAGLAGAEFERYIMIHLPV